MLFFCKWIDLPGVDHLQADVYIPVVNLLASRKVGQTVGVSDIQDKVLLLDLELVSSAELHTRIEASESVICIVKRQGGRCALGLHFAGEIVGKGWARIDMEFAEMKTRQYRYLQRMEAKGCFAATLRMRGVYLPSFSQIIEFRQNRKPGRNASLKRGATLQPAIGSLMAPELIARLAVIEIRVYQIQEQPEVSGGHSLSAFTCFKAFGCLGKCVGAQDDHT